MSALSGLAGATGRIVTAAAAPVFSFRAMGFDAASALCVGAAPGVAFNGSVFANAAGQVVHSLVAAIASYSGGLPLSAAGELCTEAAAPATFDQGVGFTAAGRVAIV